MVSASISYDKAGATSLVVGSNKSIVGVGSKGVIQGKGLRLPATSKNVIIQNVHITVSRRILITWFLADRHRTSTPAMSGAEMPSSSKAMTASG